MVYLKRKSSCPVFAVIFLLFIFIPVTAQVKNQPIAVRKQAEKKTALNYMNRAVKLVNEGKYEQAIADYKRALSLSAGNPLIYNDLGTVYAKQQRYAEALEAFKQSAVLDPDSALTYYNISVVYDQLNRPTEAIAAVRHALEIEPENTKALTQLCELNLLAQQNEESVGCYESLQKLTSLDGRAHKFYGMALLRTEKLKRAITVLNEAVRLLPKNLVVYSLLGKALYKKKRYKEAEEIFDRALRLDPGKDELRYNLAIAQLTSGNRDAAIIHYKFLKNSNPALAKKLYNSIYSGDVISVEN